MKNKIEKNIITSTVVLFLLAGNALASEEYSFGKQADKSYYKLVKNNASTTWRLEQVGGDNKTIKIILNNIEKDGSVYVNGYNGVKYNVDVGNMSTMVSTILTRNIIGPYSKDPKMTNNSAANAPVKEYIDTAVSNVAKIEQVVSGINPALGKDAVASGQYTLAVGEGANAEGQGATSVGAYSQAPEEYSTAVGHVSHAYAVAATAVGVGTQVGNVAAGGTAIGAQADSESVASVAVGVGAKATHDNSVALGAYANTSRDNEVNIGYVQEGKKAQTRILGGVSDGALATDVATVGQMTRNINEKTLVGVNADGSLTTVDGAKKTIAVNDGLVILSGKTDKIDAAVGSIDRHVADVDTRMTSVDRRVTNNTQAIRANSRQLQEHNTRLNNQQRQISENHEEMKRAAAQNAALSGLFQPYSVGKFNATAALGGYSDKQAVAVGVGYRFNEQTAAKAGVAASDGDISYNVGVNFEF